MDGGDPLCIRSPLHFRPTVHGPHVREELLVGTAHTLSRVGGGGASDDPTVTLDPLPFPRPEQTVDLLEILLEGRSTQTVSDQTIEDTTRCGCRLVHVGGVNGKGGVVALLGHDPDILLGLIFCEPVIIELEVG